MTAEPIDITNKWMVGAGGRNVVVLNPPRQLTPDEALVFAAWLVALAEYQASAPFANVLERVQNT
jgi:hypothetical protein